ncbi:putative MATE family efflux protein [Muricomes intestini]|jgi:putative MATE family efflux protein|uniref:Probable multidrug resistance protein NorM n=3 Tax=Muricomes intestini TaxID=1796634 RepID=A0A4R3K939_9FIRM|nr:MATE family efflux transporter [Muricomes intestini]TCS79428.1 putative MATE family efflux protein [Muricomes intestini]
MKENSESRNELRLLLTLALPTVIEQFLMTVVQYVDTAMVGHLGAEASASVGVTSTMVWLSNAPLYSMGVGVLANIAQASGEGDKERIKKVAMQAVWLTGIVGLAEGILMVGISPVIPNILGAGTAIRRTASHYYLIVSIPMIFRAGVLILGAGLRAVREVKKPMWINIGINVLHLLLNFLLIYPSRTVLLGNTKLHIWGANFGVEGAATATAISFSVGGMLMAEVFLTNQELGINKEKIRFDRETMLSCVKIGLPVAFERIFVSLGHVVFTAFVTSLGTVCLAAHTIALTAEQAFYIPGYGMQAAVSTLIGNALGEKDEERVRRISKLSACCAVIIMTIGGALLFFGAEAMMKLFTPDLKVVRMGARVLRLVALSEPVFAVVIICEGIYNGAGYTKVPFFTSLFSMWGVRLLFSWICIFVFKQGLTVVWLCMIADTGCRCLCSTIVYLRGNWLKAR